MDAGNGFFFLGKISYRRERPYCRGDDRHSAPVRFFEKAEAEAEAGEGEVFNFSAFPTYV